MLHEMLSNRNAALSVVCFSGQGTMTKVLKGLKGDQVSDHVCLTHSNIQCISVKNVLQRKS